MSRRWSALVLAGLLALIAPACLGGNGSSSAGGGTVLTPEQFEVKAQAICRDYRAKVADLGTPSGLGALANAGERAIELQQQELGELRALRPPAADAEQVNEMLGELQRGVDAGRDLVAAARAGDQDAVVGAAQELRVQLERANELARELGLDACVING